MANGSKGAVVWNSGLVESNRQTGIVYQGAKLKSAGSIGGM